MHDSSQVQILLSQMTGDEFPAEADYEFTTWPHEQTCDACDRTAEVYIEWQIAWEHSRPNPMGWYALNNGPYGIEEEATRNAFACAVHALDTVESAMNSEYYDGGLAVALQKEEK